MAIHSSILACKFQGQNSLVGYSPWGPKELDMTERLSFHFLFMHDQQNVHPLLGDLDKGLSLNISGFGSLIMRLKGED